MKIRVLISDNSTDADQSAELTRFASENSEQNVHLIRPPVPLAMTPHWEFAATSALAINGISHFAFLTDRMIFKEHMLEGVLRIAQQYPMDVISYSNDTLNDYAAPITFSPALRSGRLYRVDSRLLLFQTANMALHTCLPRMLNCVVPRQHFERLKKKFQSVFGSIAPDFSFCFRTLETVAAILYFDESVLLAYALGRSNGASVSRGIPSRDSEDFRASLGQARLTFRVPLPSIITVGNAIVHEYAVVRAQTGSNKFPEISSDRYMDYLAHEIFQFESRFMRSELLGVLAEAGWTPSGRFRWERCKVAMRSFIRWILTKRFDSVDEAIGFASRYHSPHLAGLEYLARRKSYEALPTRP